VEDFGDFGWLEERMWSKILSICINMTVQKASDTAGFAVLLHSGKTNRSVHISGLMVECMVPKTNNLSAATKNWASHFQHFAFFC
jgi:hypothetical protein